MPSRRRARVAAALALIASLAACGNDVDDGAGTLDPATASVAYRYMDSSVAPEYHRSYEITVAGGEARIVVDSYGDVLHDVTEPIDDATVEELLTAVGDVDDGGEGGQGECAGGTGRSLVVTDGGEPVVDLEAYPCGGEGESVAAAIDAAIDPVRALFPMEDLLRTA